MLQKEQQREAQRWLFQGRVPAQRKESLLSKELGSREKASLAFREGRVPWTGLQPLREILLEKR